MQINIGYLHWPSAYCISIFRTEPEYHSRLQSSLGPPSYCLFLPLTIS